jgi:EAL domain-containing protein (putative c-di-GMP-specific phosphodiesterase class I)
MGLRVSLDDFGTGYSSLSYLRRFPIHSLKIDRSFIKNTPRDEDAVSIVAAIAALAHSLRLQTVGEGVETAGQLELLRKLGYSEAQGFYISGPVSPDDIPALMRGQPLQFSV